MKKRDVFLLLSLVLFSVSFTFLLRADPDSHFITGYVHNATDGKSPNGMKVIAYRPSTSSDNVTDIIGPDGNSGTSNEYLIDCQLLQSPCMVGDIITIRAPLQRGYFAGPVNVTVTAAGFDVAPDMTLSKARRNHCRSSPTCR